MAKGEKSDVTLPAVEVVSADATLPAEQPEAKAGEGEACCEEGRPGVEALHKVMLAGIGAMAVAQENLGALAHRLVERGAAVEAEGKKMASHARERRQKLTARGESRMQIRLRDAMARADIATKAEIDALREQITALSEKVDQLKKPE